MPKTVELTDGERFWIKQKVGENILELEQEMQGYESPQVREDVIKEIREREKLQEKL